MHFGTLDWIIVLITLAFFVGMVVYSTRFSKSVADFLAAGRSGGRYMMTMASGMVWIGAINVVAMFELYHNAGFTPMWWVMLTTPFVLYLNITGFGVYRFRETRALTVAQFLESRYDRPTRVLAGILAWIAGMVNFGLFPIVGGGSSSPTAGSHRSSRSEAWRFRPPPWPWSCCSGSPCSSSSAVARSR